MLSAGFLSAMALTPNDSELKVYATNSGTGLMDVTTVAFNTSATAAFDADYDANKLAGALNRHTLYTVLNDAWLSINTNHDIEHTSTIPMGLEPGVSGDYVISFAGISTFDVTSTIYLEDLKTGAYHNARSGDYAFYADANDNWNRFVLHFTPAAIITPTNATCNVNGNINVQQPGAASWNYTLTDANNNLVAGGTLDVANPINVNVSTGVYKLTITDANHYTVTKFIPVTGVNGITAAAVTSATTAQENEIINFTSTNTDATSFFWNFGDGTTANGAAAVHSYSVAGSYTATLTVINANGCSSTQNIDITVTEFIATGIREASASGDAKIETLGSRLFVDFGSARVTNASIEGYNLIGQELMKDNIGSASIYSNEVNTSQQEYVIVKVKNGNETTVKKVLLTGK